MSRPGLTRERLIALFLLGVLLFTPPLLGIFNNPSRTFGIPDLYFYLFMAWTLLILLVAVVIESSDADETPAGAPETPTGSSEVENEKSGP